MSTQPPVRSEGVNNPDNVTGTKKYFLRSQAHGDEESLHEESSTRSPSPSPDSRDDRIMELEENIRQLKANNVRYHSRLAAKRPTHDAVIPDGDPENLNEESRDRDPDYEGADDSEDIETSLTKDGELLIVNEAGPLDPSPNMGNAPAASQVGSSRHSAQDRLGQRENVSESQDTRRARRLRRGLRLRAASPDLRYHLIAQRNKRGDDLRERLTSRPNIPPAAPTNGNRRTGQGSNERRQVTPPEQGVTPTTGLDVVTLIHNL